MVSITVTGATITKGFQGSKAIEEIKRGIRFRVAVRDEKGGWLYQTCHIEDKFLLEKVKMMGLRAGSDIDFLAIMRAVKIKEEGRTKDRSIFLIRHIEFARSREDDKPHPQTENIKPASGNNHLSSSQFEGTENACYMSMISRAGDENVSLRDGSGPDQRLGISDLPGFMGYEMLGEDI